jgi:hypothetical protein
MSCAFPQPPTLGFTVPLDILAFVDPPTPPTVRASVALPGVPATPTLGLAVPVPPIPEPPEVPAARASVALPGVHAAPVLGLAVSLGIIALLAWILSLPTPRGIPCPLD